MRRFVLVIVAAVCLALAAGPAMAQPKKGGQHQKKKRKKGAKKKQGKGQPTTAFAKAGTWTLGGTGTLDVRYLDGDVSGDDKNGPLNFTLSPVVSYFVMDGLELRLGPTFSYQRFLVTKAPDLFTLAGGAVIGGYYNHELMGTLFLTAGLDAQLMSGKTKVENTSAEAKIFDWIVGPRAGLTLAFGGKFGGFVRALAFYDYGGRSYTNDPGGIEADDTINNFGVQTSLGIFF